MRNPVCDHCEYKHPSCSSFFERVRCPIYKGAEFKRVERRRVRVFGDNYHAEDWYDMHLIIRWTLIAIIILYAIFCTIKVTGEWWT